MAGVLSADSDDDSVVGFLVGEAQLFFALASDSAQLFLCLLFFLRSPLGRSGLVGPVRSVCEQALPFVFVVIILAVGLLHVARLPLFFAEQGVGGGVRPGLDVDDFLLLYAVLDSLHGDFDLPFDGCGLLLGVRLGGALLNGLEEFVRW